MKTHGIRLVLLLAACIIGGPVQGNENMAEYIGGSECKSCHKGQVRSYLVGKHGKIFTRNPRDEKEARGCEACHGPGSLHTQVVGELDYSGPLNIRAFKYPATAEESNKVCVGCHESGARMHWRGSTHNVQGVVCTSCHAIHSESPVPSMDVCFGCHKSQRARLQRSAHMPLREGKVTCMDCHNPHGGPGPGLLKTASVNEACYQCHTEKRGPTVFEHPPVRENCAICHEPHGSNHPSMLRKKLPYLCQECHSMSGHVGRLYDGTELEDPAIRQMRGKACTNCHSRIHGSNHPSGAVYQR